MQNISFYALCNFVRIATSYNCIHNWQMKSISTFQPSKTNLNSHNKLTDMMCWYQSMLRMNRLWTVCRIIYLLNFVTIYGSLVVYRTYTLSYATSRVANPIHGYCRRHNFQKVDSCLYSHLVTLKWNIGNWPTRFERIFFFTTVRIHNRNHVICKRL